MHLKNLNLVVVHKFIGQEEYEQCGCKLVIHSGELLCVPESKEYRGASILGTLDAAEVLEFLKPVETYQRGDVFLVESIGIRCLCMLSYVGGNKFALIALHDGLCFINSVSLDDHPMYIPASSIDKLVGEDVKWVKVCSAELHYSIDKTLSQNAHITFR